jgi:hypothetical protein
LEKIMVDKDSQAERAAGITDAEIAGIMGWRGPGAYTEATLRKIKRILEEDRSRRAAPPALDAEGLPAPRNKAGDFEPWAPVYADHEVAWIVRQAIAADRAQLAANAKARKDTND